MATDSMASITSLVIAGSTTKGEATTSKAAVAVARSAEQRQKLAEAQQASAEQIEVTQETLDRVTSELKDFAQNMQRDLNFHVDDVTGRVVIRVVDATTEKVIRQIPQEEVLALARRMAEMLENAPTGVLLEREA
ncbi:MAG: flagellar protein FlaG [Gammaproteobacteria bacterium]|nr:flagellar protein FlaG [Gammaproteobacteria bacterium]MDH5777370.1 flagellar protein FlaG [Gammaproteobacteria bacterium]